MLRAPFRFLSLMSLSIMISFSVNHKTYANEISLYAIDNRTCFANNGGIKSYSLEYKLSVNDIQANTPKNSVVGTLSFRNTSFGCYNAYNNDWYLQISPLSPSISGMPTVCKTNIKGIGIQYLNINGTPIVCSRWDSIFKIERNTDNGLLKDGTVLARLIRIDGPLDNGEHQLSLPASISAYYNGGSDSTAWGSLILRGSSRVYISTFHPLIYFPASPSSQPVVRLGIKKKLPGSGTNSVKETTNLDMCLFDGSNSVSGGIKLLFKDDAQGVSGRQSGLFSIFRTGGDKSLTENRIDYSVKVLNPTTNSLQELKNGVEFSWRNANERRIQRQVVLPGIPGISLCVPAPITLSTSSVNISEKTSGNYSGTLTVIYTPTTS